MHSLLRCQKKRRKRYGGGRERRGCIAKRVCIEQRLSIVGKKSRIGDWEGDTVVGKDHQGFLVTMVERKLRYTLAVQVDSKEALPLRRGNYCDATPVQARALYHHV